MYGTEGTLSTVLLSSCCVPYMNRTAIWGRSSKQSRQLTFNFVEPEEESRMHAEPESETIPCWDSWYSSHVSLPQWSLTPDIDTGVQLFSYAINY